MEQEQIKETKSMSRLEKIVTAIKKPEFKDKFLSRIPVNVDGERLFDIAVNEIVQEPNFEKCNFESIKKSLLEVAEVGLSVSKGNGLSYLIPRVPRDKPGVCVYMVGYQGYIQLSYKSPRVIQIYSNVVYQGDEFDVFSGTDPKIHHKPLNKSRVITNAYAYAKLTMGGNLFEVFDTEDIANCRKLSIYGGFWKSWEKEMTRKLPIKNLVKFLPDAPEAQKAASFDNANEFNSIDGLNKNSQYSENNII